MSFLSSLFLWALPLAAIPVVIHLLNRRRRQVVRWGAMHLLLESVPRRRRIWRFDDILLMLLRALAVAALILALARPQVRSSWFSGTNPGRDVIFIVDASLSTSRLHDGAPVFDAIKAKAAELIATLEESDHVRLMLAALSGHWAAGNATSNSSSTREALAEKVAALKPTLASADMPACVQTALQAESPADATSRLIVIVTDGTAHGWNAEAGSQWQTIRQVVEQATVPTALNVVTVNAPVAAPSNVTVEKLSMNRTRVASDEPFTVTAQIRNNGDGARAATTAKWELGGEPQGESAVAALEPGQSIEIGFETSCSAPGAYELACNVIADDDLPLDNAASIVVESLERLPILVCRDEAELTRLEGEPDFLKAALALRPETAGKDDTLGAFEPTIVSIDALAASDLSRYRCLVLDDVMPTSPEAIDALADFVQKGGGLWLILGENTTAEQFNAAFYHDGAGLLSFPLEKRVEAGSDENDLFSIHPPEGTHPATMLLGDTERLDIDDVRIRRHWKISAGDSGDEFSVLLETGDGEPLAVEHLLGDGRIIVQALPCRPDWSNLPVCQAFVPMAHEWIWYLTQPTAVAYNLEAGAPISVPADALRQLKEASLRTPLGEMLTLREQGAAATGPIRFRGTAFPGTYDLTLVPTRGEDRLLPYYVRRDEDESRLAPIGDEQIAALTTSGGIRFGADPFSLPESITSAVRYQPFWTYLLALVVLLFLAEFAFTYLMTRNRYADATEPAASIAASGKAIPEVMRQSA